MNALLVVCSLALAQACSFDPSGVGVRDGAHNSDSTGAAPEATDPTNAENPSAIPVDRPASPNSDALESDTLEVTLCHGVPPEPLTIVVEPSSVPGHLAHGDTLGPCPDGEEGHDGDEEIHDEDPEEGHDGDPKEGHDGDD